MSENLNSCSLIRYVGPPFRPSPRRQHLFPPMGFSVPRHCTPSDVRSLFLVANLRRVVSTKRTFTSVLNLERHTRTLTGGGAAPAEAPPPRSRFLPVFSQTFVNNILFASLAAYSNTLTQDGRTWLWLNNKVLTNIYFFTTKVGLAVFTGIGEALPRWAEARVSQRVRWGSRKLLQWLCWTGRGRGPAPMLAFCLQEVSDRNTVFLRACTLPYLSSWNCPPIHRRTK